LEEEVAEVFIDEARERTWERRERARLLWEGSILLIGGEGTK